MKADRLVVCILTSFLTINSSLPREGVRSAELGLVDASSDSSSSVCKGAEGEEARMNLLIYEIQAVFD